MLKSITLLPERITNPTAYPFSVPAISTFRRLDITSRVLCFAGENGTGKSTLLEAIAAHIGFGREGGNRDMRFETSESVAATEPLIRALRLGFDKRTGEGFFFRAESLFSVATQIDEWDSDSSFGGKIRDSYGGVSLHDHSHGETFFTVLDHKFRRSGLFLLNEPEAALSPQRQLAFLVLIHATLRDYKDAQFIISTHSPLLLGYPGAQIVSFDGGRLQPIDYDRTYPYLIIRRFLTDRTQMLEDLFRNPEADPDDQSTLFD
ncbi:AAA family ATPase [Granulicella tundricola]|uniref:AAA ATPase n=1 Tax=Granulicella tundricola (strain ATCC BAA-1859 / DSM 23138 / MP5ACTX9) TaxID=1198114 RepID=E8X231_GRATM|nr:AAA family ATPase [Granulicella tundricola]ADW70274.1 AAA ATPase [Granulicella tundricola MP5ACTX9]